MRAFGFISLIVVMAIGVYLYSVQLRGTSAPGQAANPTAVTDSVSVKGDLLSIGSAERRFYATEGHYASFDELKEGSYITFPKQKQHYTYDVETSDAGFRATATRDDGGSPAQLSIDESMEIHSSN